MNTHENENKIKFNDEQLLKIKNDNEIKSLICDVNNAFDDMSKHVDKNTSLKLQNIFNKYMPDIKNEFKR